jgi:glycosyltransferase involved in cell wall biosynthesis
MSTPNRPLKVLMLINSLQQGGTERNVVAFCTHIDRQRYEPEVWCLTSGGAFEESVKMAGVCVSSFERTALTKYDPRFMGRVARAIAKSNADLVHIFLPQMAFYSMISHLFYRLRKPLVLSDGNAGPQTFFQPCLYRGFVRRHCLRVIANSESVKQYLLSLGCDPERLRVIPNGHYDSGVAKRSRLELRRELNLAQDAEVIVSVGRFAPQKRHIDIIDAFAQLSEKYPRARLLLVGDGEESDCIHRRVALRGLECKVVFAGMRNDVRELLRASDMFVYASVMDGLANTVIEACFAGLPIVACSSPGVIDIVRHAETALLGPPRDPMRLFQLMDELLRRPEERKRLAENAREFAMKNFSIEQSLNKLYRVYAEALDEYSGKSRRSCDYQNPSCPG